MIGIIDYGLGNLTSVKNALDKLEVPNFISSDIEKLKTTQGLILPGVGAAGAGMKNLISKGLDQFLIEEVNNGKPFLGTCLGMQLLFEFSEEGNTKCLGILNGKVKKFSSPSSPRRRGPLSNFKIPQMGWNNVKVVNPKSQILKDIKSESYFYFVNSYYCEPEKNSIISGTTNYGITFPSIIEKDNIFATQFHSEKSGEIGLRLLENFTKGCQ